MCYLLLFAILKIRVEYFEASEFVKVLCNDSDNMPPPSRQSRHLWVGNLPEDIDKERITDYFSRCPVLYLMLTNHCVFAGLVKLREFTYYHSDILDKALPLLLIFTTFMQRWTRCRPPTLLVDEKFASTTSLRMAAVAPDLVGTSRAPRVKKRSDMVIRKRNREGIIDAACFLENQLS